MTKTATKAPPRQLQHPITNENLYQPDKFKVHIGTGTVGFCTVWNEPKAAVARVPALHEKAAIVGTLYSTQGVNVVLRNLALNPFIRKLYVWGHGALSNTKFGIVGSGALTKLWQQGVAEDYTVPGTPFKLEKEIDLKVVDQIRQHVELIDVSGEELEEAVAKIEASDPEPYMKPVRFPDAELEEPETFPSEQIGWAIHGQTIVDTWTRLVERIIRYGTVKGTQYGSEQKELIGATWVVHNEDPNNFYLPEEWPKELREVTGTTREAIDEYHQVFLSPDPPAGVSYTYGNRLMRYPVPGSKDRTIDQIEKSIIRNLKASPDSRRAVATTYVPWIDAENDEPPCITQVQAIQAEGKLNFLVTVRSHDIFKAALPNAFGLRILQQRIAKETGFSLGALQITSQSAHIYESDWENAKKLVTCAIWENPVQKITEEDADPRGVFVIRVTGKEITVDFNSKDGTPLLQFSGTNADRLTLEISKHELFSQTGHALDIGIQLARAEVALKKGLEFTQDRPLAL